MALRRKNQNRGDPDLTSLVASGASGAYEALQLYRSRANRNASKGNYTEASTTCAIGAATLLEGGYETAGAELAQLLITFLIDSHAEVNQANMKLVLDLDDKFKAASEKYKATSTLIVPAHIEFLKAAIRWTFLGGNREGGDAVLHTRLAVILFVEKDKTAAYHFAAGEAPEEYINSIFSLYPLEGGDVEDNAVNRVKNLLIGVVHFLALEDLRDSNKLFELFNKKTQDAKFNSSTYSTLYTFTDYLLRVSQYDAAPLFKTLVNKYASDVDFDESVPTLLMGPIASKLFGIKPKVSPMVSMFQSLMS